MNTDTILRLLKNSGFHVLGADGSFIYLEDPSCILRSFDTFIEYAWLAITFITGMLLFGWAISLIRGAKNDLMTNLRNLMLIFGALSLAHPIINLVYGDDLFARGCRTIQVSHDAVNKLLDARNAQLGTRGNELYENFDIYDSGVIQNPAQMPYAVAPTPGAGNPTAIELIADHNPTPTGAPAPTPRRDNNPTATGTNISDRPTPNPSAVGATPVTISQAISAAAAGNDVIYTHSDGMKLKRTGGTRAWRNKNPGNIRYSKFAQNAGAIGTAGGFAVFPDEDTGISAITALLRSDTYRNLTVGDAIRRYAPPHENDTRAYQRYLERLTGVKIDTRINDLNPAELARIAAAIKTIEGWTPGREIRL